MAMTSVGVFNLSEGTSSMTDVVDTYTSPPRACTNWYSERPSTATTWSYAHDGKKINGKVQLLSNGKVTWKGGKAQGTWHRRRKGIYIEWGGVAHRLRYEI